MEGRSVTPIHWPMTGPTGGRHSQYLIPGNSLQGLEKLFSIILFRLYVSLAYYSFIFLINPLLRHGFGPFSSMYFFG